jgi:hypothetical protein
MNNFEVIKNLSEGVSDFIEAINDEEPKTPRLRRSESITYSDNKQWTEHEQALFDNFMAEETSIAPGEEKPQRLKNREFLHLQTEVMGLGYQAEALHKRTLENAIEIGEKLVLGQAEITSILKQVDDRVDLLIKLLSLKPNNNRNKK